MRRLALLLILFAAPIQAESWVFRPSYYSHNARGQQVTQYAAPPSAYRPDYDYRQTVYRYWHLHNSDSCEHWHQTETWTTR